MNHEEVLAQEEERIRNSFELAMAMVKGGMKVLIENGIMPLSEHQGIALQWGMGELSNEEFVAAARVISEAAEK